MNIKEDEIKEIKKLGNLHGSDVKLVTLKGGFHIGMGRKTKSAKKSDILAVGSHPALVSHQISKQYDSFEQAMAKNESESMGEVIDYSHNLTSPQKNVLGLDIYAIKKNEKIDFKITKHNFEIFSIEAVNDKNELCLSKSHKDDRRLYNVDKKELSKRLSKTIKEYADKNGLKIEKKF